MFKKFILYSIIVYSSTINFLQAKEQLFAVGSSTVYPFVTVVAENFGDNTGYKSPVIESTGTGGGFKLFCQGVGSKFPDFTNASREIKQSEINLCKENGVTDIAEVKIGYDGIVLANSKKAKQYHLTTEQVFLALATYVPINGKLEENPYKKWSDIDSSLPNKDIYVYGPPSTSGTRDAFVELVMQHSCVNIKEFKAAYPDKKLRKKACSSMREDGVFIEAGENDNLIVQKLRSNEDSLGIFGFSFLEQNLNFVQGSVINSFKATFDNIASGDYPVSRSLFVYIKSQHYQTKPSLKEFVAELISEDTLGDEGYLTYKGLIPLSDDELEDVRARLLINL